MAKVKKNTARSKAILGKVNIDEGETLDIGADAHKGDCHIAVWLQK